MSRLVGKTFPEPKVKASRPRRGRKPSAAKPEPEAGKKPEEASNAD